jgi:hypothetical protein
MLPALLQYIVTKTIFCHNKRLGGVVGYHVSLTKRSFAEFNTLKVGSSSLP